MDIEILSLFPVDFFRPFDESILKRAREKGLLNIRHVQIRDFAIGKHRRVDDRPYGGGPGMVLKPEPVVKAIRSVRRAESHVIYLSPQGVLLNAQKCRSLAQKPHLILLCGHYEGVDERALEQEVDEEVSIGDYVLTDGALAAIVLINAMSRFIPGVLGHPEAAGEDSFERGLLDYPHYTRPENFEGKKVPELLPNGDHQEIARWRKEMALKNTCEKRPDLYQRYLKHKETSNGCLD
jgi:tRNA (guanine37-N1)-methyltransferase